MQFFCWQARNYLHEVRKPLMELLPQLEEERRRVSRVRGGVVTQTKVDQTYGVCTYLVAGHIPLSPSHYL